MPDPPYGRLRRSPREQVPPGSAWEEQVAASILYGMLHGFITFGKDLLGEHFEFRGVELSESADGKRGVVYDGLTIKMASGDYRVKIERVPA